MIDMALRFLDGFATWQTPVSFLAGFGAAKLINQYAPTMKIERNEDDVQEA